jgi:molybdopterin synthase catalytic subunit
MIRVQAEPFDPGQEINRFAAGRTDIGELASFTGFVRDRHAGERIVAMTLEH